MQKWKFIIFLLLILLVPLLSCSPKTDQSPVQGQEPEVDEWEIVNLTVSSGPMAALQADQWWFIDQAAKDINADGGIRGIPVKVKHYDTACNPDKAVQMFAKAADEGCLAIIGPSYTFEAVACGPMAERAGIPYFPIDTPWADSVECMPWIVNLSINGYDLAAEGFSEYLSRHPEIDTISPIYHPDIDASSVVKDMSMDKAVEQGVEVLAGAEVPSTTVDVDPMVLKALSQNPDAYFVSCFSESSTQIIKALKEGDVPAERIFGSFGNFGDWYFKLGGEALHGTYIADLYNAFDDSPEWQRVRELFEEETGKRYPQQACNDFYSALYIIKDVIEEEQLTGDPARRAEERAAIRDWAYSMDDWQGIIQSYTMIPEYGGCTGVGALYIIQPEGPELVKEVYAPEIPQIE